MTFYEGAKMFKASLKHFNKDGNKTLSFQTLLQSTFTYLIVSTVKYVNYIIQKCTFFHHWLWPRLAADWEDDKNVISHQINRRMASRQQSGLNQTLTQCKYPLDLTIRMMGKHETELNEHESWQM